MTFTASALTAIIIIILCQKASKVKCQNNDEKYHPCKEQRRFHSTTNFISTVCDINTDYISRYTKMYKCATIQAIWNVTTGAKIGIKCEMKHAAVVNKKDSTFLIAKHRPEHIGSPCGEPVKRYSFQMNIVTRECRKGQEFSTPEYREIFKCQTITRQVTLPNGITANVKVGCEARFKYDCRHGHPNCKVIPQKKMLQSKK